MTESEVVELQIKDCRKMIEQLEKIKKALELHKASLNKILCFNDGVNIPVYAITF